ncbi:MAG: NusG domain II-containing protein [Magnetococcales bacterium]|nr:NusG domain II-containing protein [Magnetococcales bacterium]MBF0157140.1 NusG domain II-containing protein [Magnetococcales bacterium]
MRPGRFLRETIPLAGAAFRSLRGATTPWDRWLIGVSAIGIVLLGYQQRLTATPGGEVVVLRDNRAVRVLPLDREAWVEVEGKLGRVKVETRRGGARLLEYRSPRLIGTRTGWITRTGQVAACVPCGIMLVLRGSPAVSGEGISPPGERFDALAE